ncbi:Bcr/CflA family efflux MFS transporter [Poseidonocella sp. HB161398]|uniref:Bcr/CflA family efflux MFS transporter n=1 Tax=Poseidonocella sp. HB161398 TaxID=2320855 RepID=UPI0011084939|nr:Bcr/CflA family efflux MFS transporter [Poseidonocella sp. HB161398]
MNSRPRIAAITAVLALLAVFPPIATDMYLAAMGEIAEAFGTTRSGAELSLSLFFLGLCAGQLVMGPLIDAFGRKGPLLAGVVLFTATSVGLLLTRDIAVFNTLRFFQAVGACAGMVVGRAVVSDLYSGREAAKMMTVLVMLMTLGPILSPSIGSLLLGAFGWESIFVAMVAVGLAALALAQAVLPETLPREKRAADPFGAARANALRLLGRRAFLFPALVAGLVQGAMFAFITGSSGVFQGVYGLGATAYGVLFGLVAAALVIFGQVNSWLLNRHEPQRIVDAGLPVFVAAAAVLALVSQSPALWMVLVPLWIAIGMVGLLSANAMSITMAASGGGAGMGSALLGAIQFAIAFLVSSSVALGSGGSALAMALGILLPGAAALGLWLAMRRSGVVAADRTAG